MKQVHKKKGHKLKADEDLKRTNKSQTLKAAHDFCTLYMKDQHKATLDLVNEEDMYISVSELKKQATELFKKQPTVDDVEIDNESLYKLYF